MWFQKMQTALNRKGHISINSLSSTFGWNVSDVSIASEVYADWKRGLLFASSPCPQRLFLKIRMLQGKKTNVIFNCVANILWNLQSTDCTGNDITHLDLKLPRLYILFFPGVREHFGGRRYNTVRLHLTFPKWHTCVFTCAWVCVGVYNR